MWRSPWPVTTGRSRRVAAATLRTPTRGEIGDDAVQRILSGFSELPAHPDAEPAMWPLAEAGIRVVCLSMGAAQTKLDFVQRTGLANHVEQVISVADLLAGEGWLSHRAGRAGRRTCHSLPRCSSGRTDDGGGPAGWRGSIRGSSAPAESWGRDLVEVAHRLLLP